MAEIQEKVFAFEGFFKFFFGRGAVGDGGGEVEGLEGLLEDGLGVFEVAAGV